MATLQELESALVKADAAGNTEDAKALADAVRAARAQPDAKPVSKGKVDVNSPDYPTFSAVPAPTLAQRIRESSLVSGVLGPTENQKMEKRAALQSLYNISPALGHAVQEATQEVSAQPLREMGGAIIDMGAEAAGSAGGQALGAMTGPVAPVAVPVLGSIGGAAGNTIGQLRRMWMGDQQGFKPGQVAGAAITGAVPGGSLAKAGAKTLLKESVKNAVANDVSLITQNTIDNQPTTSKQLAIASVAGAGGPLLGKYLDLGKNRLASAATKAESLDAPRVQIMKAATDAGYQFPPSTLNRNGAGVAGKINNLLESVGGKAATAQEAQIKNQAITNEIARKEIGLADDVPITMDVLQKARDAASQPYEYIDNMAQQAKSNLAALEKSAFVADPHELAIKRADPKFLAQQASLWTKAQASIQDWKQASSDYKNFMQTAKATGDASAYEKANAALDRMESEHSKIVAAANDIGDKSLVDKLREAKILYAKSYEIEKALNVSTGDVDAAVIGKSFDKSPQKFTDGLKTIGQTQNAFSRYLTDATKTPAPGVNKLSTYLLAGGGAAIGSQFGGSGVGFGTMAGLMAATAGEGPARKLALSRFYNQTAGMGKPNYGYTMPDFNAQLAKYMTMQAGRRPNNTSQ